MGFTDSTLTEEKKLIWAGLKRAQQDFNTGDNEISKIESNISWATFQGHLDAYDIDEDGTDEDISSYPEFKTYLGLEHGFTTEEQDTFVDKIKANFSDEDSSGTSYDEFEEYVENEATSFSQLTNQFSTTNTFSTETKTEDGEPVAGIRVHDSAGVSYAGVPVEAGTTEVFGRRVEFSQQEPPRAEDGTISYANLTTDDADNVVNVFASIEISADVTNSNTGDRQVTVTLTEDGSVLKEKTVTINGGSTQNVSFTVTKTEYVCHDYSIGGLSAVTVCWAPSGLTV
jgi:hypothetical protein